jgi:hypothetical protein
VPLHKTIETAGGDAGVMRPSVLRPQRGQVQMDGAPTGNVAAQAFGIVEQQFFVAR